MVDLHAAAILSKLPRVGGCEIATRRCPLAMVLSWWRSMWRRRSWSCAWSYETAAVWPDSPLAASGVVAVVYSGLVFVCTIDFAIWLDTSISVVQSAVCSIVSRRRRLTGIAYRWAKLNDRTVLWFSMSLLIVYIVKCLQVTSYDSEKLLGSLPKHCHCRFVAKWKKNYVASCFLKLHCWVRKNFRKSNIIWTTKSIRTAYMTWD